MLATSNVYSGFLQKLRRYIRRHEMLLGGEPLLVAVSGGIDSMVLLDMLMRLAPTLNLTLGVAHYEHGLRGETSKEDAQFVVETARQHGLKVYVGHGDVKQIAEDHKLSIEEAARRARYTFLRKVARKHRFPVVATGHTANDNAETVLLNLIRGSGVRGLAAIPPMRQMGEGVILARPLLDFERSEIERYAKEMSIVWREDESNESARFVRNRLRAELLPMLQSYNPSIVGTLNTTAEIMRNLEQYLSHSVQTAIERVTVEKSKERLALNLHQIKHFLPAMQTEIVQRGVSQAFDIPPISFSATERALALLYRETGQKADLGAGLTALRDRDALVVLRELPLPPELEYSFSKGEEVEAGRVRLKSVVIPRERVQFTKNSRVEFFDADKLADDLVLRSWREGDRFRPLGMDGEKKVSDFLVDAKTPRDRKRHVLVLTADDEIVWVCGMRIDDRYKVTDETKSVLKIEMQVLSPNQVHSTEPRSERGPGRGAQKGERGPRRSESGGRGDSGARNDNGRGERREGPRRDVRKDDERARDERIRDEKTSEDRAPVESVRDDRPREDRPRDDRPRDDRPRDDRPRDDRPRADRSRDDRPRDDRPRGDRARDDRPQGGRAKDERPRDDRPRDDQARADRSRDDRPQGGGARDDRARDDRPPGGSARDERPRDDRSREDRPRDDRSRDDRARDDRSRDDRPREDRPRDDRPRDERPRSDRGRDDRARDDRRRDDGVREERPRNERSDARRSDDRGDVTPRDERKHDDAGGGAGHEAKTARTVDANDDHSRDEIAPVRGTDRDDGGRGKRRNDRGRGGRSRSDNGDRDRSPDSVRSANELAADAPRLDDPEPESDRSDERRRDDRPRSQGSPGESSRDARADAPKDRPAPADVQKDVPAPAADHSSDVSTQDPVIGAGGKPAKPAGRSPRAKATPRAKPEGTARRAPARAPRSKKPGPDSGATDPASPEE